MNNALQAATLSLCLVYAAYATPSTIPATSGTALDGHTISLPRDLNTHATILILGFSKNSADTTTAWEKPVLLGLATQPSIGFYDMPFLQDAPSFLRPLILRNIRKKVPDVLKPNFVPLTTGESTWKQLTHFSPATPDAAYVLLVDRNGKILWQTHEAFTQARFDELSAAARKLATESR